MAINPNRSKCPINAERVTDGRGFNFPTGNVAMRLSSVHARRKYTLCSFKSPNMQLRAPYPKLGWKTCLFIGLYSIQRLQICNSVLKTPYDPQRPAPCAIPLSDCLRQPLRWVDIILSGDFDWHSGATERTICPTVASQVRQRAGKMSMFAKCTSLAWFYEQTF